MESAPNKPQIRANSARRSTAPRSAVSALEFEARARDVAEHADRMGLDAVLVWSRGGGTVDRHGNVLYLTNYYNPWPAVPDLNPHWSGQGHAATLVARTGSRTLLTNVPRGEWGAAPVFAEKFVCDARLERAVATALSGITPRPRRVGFAGTDAISVDLYKLLANEVPGIELVPADDILADLRRVKSRAEIDVIRGAGEVATAVMAAMLEQVRPGVAEAEIQAAGLAAGLSLGLTPYDAPSSSGASARMASPSSLPSWSDRRLEAGDLWHVDLYGVWAGYLFDFSRTTVAGTASIAQIAAMEAPIRVVEAVLAQLRPGVAFAQAYEAGVRVLEGVLLERGLPFNGPVDYPHFGHGLGLGWEGPWIAGSEGRPVEEGNYLAVECSITIPDIGRVMFEENVVVLDHGLDVLTRADRRPWTTA